eukprot:TRINITY_DN39402_c0_g1_i1.p1 TRINITY_DN39402_c0_g1~~TRINITY_DN39402_c0_g1_i1.p1  ORF type:complete len:1096 (+),score=147.85 TRINITY_DN39402_c0_g1_i1:111-3290(+)
MSPYLKYTGDADGVVKDAGGNVKGKCWKVQGGVIKEAADGVFFINPHCRGTGLGHRCIPVISAGDGWGHDTFVQQTTAWSIPAAFGVVTWGTYLAMPRAHSVMLYWWTPDVSFIDLRPEKVVMPPHDAYAYSNGDKRTADRSGKLEKLATPWLRRAAPLVHKFLQKSLISYSVLSKLLISYQKAKNKNNNVAESDVACKWVKENYQAIWQSWIPDSTTCQEGQGMIGRDGNYVQRRGDAKECEWCKLGHMSAKINDAGDTFVCRECQPGKYQVLPGMTQCLDCAAGTSVNKSKARECDKCPAGKVSQVTGASVCLNCTAGTYAAQVGETQCTQCKAGSSQPQSGKTECELCGTGFYQPVRGSAKCNSCQDFLKASTSQRGSQLKSECQCPEKHLRLASGTCGKCDEDLLVCPGRARDSEVFSVKYYSLALTSVTEDRGENPVPNMVHKKNNVSLGWTSVPFVYKCKSSAACPGGLVPGVCPEGHTGAACGHFLADYSADDGSCKACGAAQGGKVLFLLFCIMCCWGLALVVLHVLGRSQLSHMSALAALASVLGVFVNFLQLGLVLPEVSFQWPPLFKRMLGSFAFLAFNLEFMQLDCIAGYSNPAFVLTQKMVVWIMFTAQVFIAWVLIESGILGKRFPKLGLQGLTNSTGFVSNMAFVPMAMSAFSMLNCYSHPNEGSSMNQLSYVVCFESLWMSSALPAGICGLLVVLLLFSVIFFLTRKGPRFQDPKLITFLLARFRPEGYYWGAALITRNLILCCIPVFSRNPFIVGFSMVLACLAYTIALLRVWPWRTDILNFADGMSMWCLLFTVHSGGAFSEFPSYPSAKNQTATVWQVLQALTCMPMFGVVAGILFILVKGFYEVKVDWRGQEAEKIMGRLTALAQDFADLVKLSEKDPDVKTKVENNLGQMSTYDLRGVLCANFLVRTLILGDQEYSERTRGNTVGRRRSSIGITRVNVTRIQNLLELVIQRRAAQSLESSMSEEKARQSVVGDAAADMDEALVTAKEEQNGTAAKPVIDAPIEEMTKGNGLPSKATTAANLLGRELSEIHLEVEEFKV